jgi:hypothetical protein
VLIMPHRGNRALAVLAVLAVSTAEAHAQSRLDLEYALSARDGRSVDQGLPLTFGGVAPSQLRASGGWLYRDMVGLAAGVAYEWFVARGTDVVDAPVSTALQGLALHAGAAGQLHFGGLCLEGQVGWAYGFAPGLKLSGTTFAPSPFEHHGPQVGVRVEYRFARAFSAEARARWLPVSVGPSFAQLEAGARLVAGAWPIGPVELGVLAEYDFEHAWGARAQGDFSANAHRFGLGLRFAYRAKSEEPAGEAVPLPPPELKPEPPKSDALPVVPRVATGPGRISGTVLGIEGAHVSAGGREVTTGPGGRFVLEGVGPGPVELTATAAGFEKGEEVISVPPEGTAEVELSLRKVQAAPALVTVKGVVTSTRGAPLQARVSVPEAGVTVRTRKDGTYSLQLKGGRYTMRIEAAGYTAQTRTVDLDPGDQGIFHIELSPER